MHGLLGWILASWGLKTCNGGFARSRNTCIERLAMSLNTYIEAPCKRSQYMFGVALQGAPHTCIEGLAGSLNTCIEASCKGSKEMHGLLGWILAS